MIWKNVRERKGLYMGLTHFDENGKAVMVDVTDKKETAREAVAEGKILVNRDVFQAVKAGTVGKGDVLAVAATAGIAGAKRTSDLIPMGHILPLTNCKVDFRMNEKECAIFCTCTVKVTGKTGVEMEALTGVSAALLTIYDMCKGKRCICHSSITPFTAILSPILVPSRTFRAFTARIPDSPVSCI